jgi:hypothetical protein
MPFFLGLLAAVAINAGIYILTAWARAPQIATKSKPNFPTADPEKVLPIIFGTVRLPINVYRTAPVVTQAITRNKVWFSGWFGKDIVGYRYYYTFGAWLCHGNLSGFLDVIIDGKYFLSRITPEQVDNGVVANSYTDVQGNAVTLYSPQYAVDGVMNGSTAWLNGMLPDGMVINLKVPSLFGDPVIQGGVQGVIRLYPGDGSHLANARLTAQVPPGEPDWEEPAYPEYAHIVAEDLWLGNSGNPPGLEIVVARGTAKLGFGNPLYGYPSSPWGGSNSGFAQGDANPIGMIYEILVSS